MAAILQLPRTRESFHISGLNKSITSSKFSVSTIIKSRYNGFKTNLDFLTVPSITSFTPIQQINRKNIPLPHNIELADPEFHIPAPVHILLGAGTSLKTLCIGQITLSSSPDLVLQKTQLGWIVGGNLPLYHKSIKNAKCHVTNLHADIERFWEIEDCPTTRHFSNEEMECEKHFSIHTKRDSSGRYTVALPFNDKKDRLGESYTMALKRFQALERRFKRDANFHMQYKKVIEEYYHLGYIQKLQGQPQQGFYLPHQAVIKDSSLTTKVRVVFDASAASSTGLSLNDTLLSGPTIQSDIFCLLLRFRLHNYVLTGDIEKMYLQIKVQANDQPYLRILWREDDGTLTTLQFNRLIFGLKPAAFMAIRTLHQLADDEKLNYAQAAKIIKRDLYVDDLLTGADTLEELVQLQQQITSLLRVGGFNLRQCASNNPHILNTIPDSKLNLQLHGNNDDTLKTLGVHWNSSRDTIVYTVKPIISNRVTKRIIFSEISKIFDPLGLLNPVIVTIKILMQELWRLKLDWDESLPANIHENWLNFATQLPTLNDIAFERKMLTKQYKYAELHGFCDASEKAFGACIYIYSHDESGNSQIQLYCAKSRVAPIKNKQTIPRLELCAAALLADLFHNVQSAINIQFNRTIFWTDSMIALHWIHTSPHLLKTFVANRVASIIAKTDVSSWRHVRSHDNPADLLSRGMLPHEFKNSSLWFRGPIWLSDGENKWPSQPIIESKNLPDLKKPICLLSPMINDDILLRYSTYEKLRRIVAICLRLRRPIKNPKLISVPELKNASNRILQLVQRSKFAEEYNALLNKRELSTKSKLLPLKPFLDNDNLIRVGGRLHFSSLSYDQKHPIILPKSHHITDLLITQEHTENMHSGIQHTLYSMRQKYWPIDGRSQVRKVVRRCVLCSRARPKPVNYTMGSLPAARTTQARPFSNVGVDYCGPFLIKEKKYRNKNQIKIYVAVFICFATKAVHLETVSDLTTEGFLAALKRMISRRGKCSTIYSDNGTNFVGANRALQDLQDLLTSETHNQKVHNYLAEKGINWQFNPPHAPHFGGLWEAAVKSFKHHFRRIIGSQLFTFEQFNTLVIEIEAILNSRPLTPLSSDSNDLNVLTPSHFLIGDRLSSLPEHDFTGTPSNRLSLWQHIQKVKQDFWVRWHKEYINELNVRAKWSHGSHPIKENSIVIVRDDNLPPLQWKFGRVLEIHTGHDGIIRTLRLKTSNGEIIRAVKKLAPLPIDDNDKDKTVKLQK